MKNALAQARWALARGAVRPGQLASYARMAAVQARHPDVTFLGPCFLYGDVRFDVRRGYGRIIVGPWAHIGPGSRLRCHEGTLRIGAKTVLGARTTINTWLDIDIGDACLFGDDVYLCDFDHVTDRLDIPIKDQGITKAPIRIGDDVWLGTKVVITRGTRLGPGTVVGASSVVRGDIPAYSVVVGAPGRVVRNRDPEVDRLRRLAGMPEPRLRDAVRALVVDEWGRILLLHYDLADVPGGVWGCPGTEAGPEGDAVAKLAAEVELVTGVRIEGVGDPVWVRELLLPDDDGTDGLRETFYLLEISGVDPRVDDVDTGVLALPDVVDAVRWWTPDQVRAARRSQEEDPSAPEVLFSPLTLGHLLGDLFSDGRPAAPVQVPVADEPLPPTIR